MRLRPEERPRILMVVRESGSSTGIRRCGVVETVARARINRWSEKARAKIVKKIVKAQVKIAKKGRARG